MRKCFGISPNSYLWSMIWTASSEFGANRICEQRRFRRACASAQSRQNLRCSLIQAVSQEEPSNRKPDPWPLWMAGHAQLKFVMTECSKTQIRLTGLIWYAEIYFDTLSLYDKFLFIMPSSEMGIISMVMLVLILERGFMFVNNPHVPNVPYWGITIHVWGVGRQRGTRSGAAEHSVWSGSTMLAYRKERLYLRRVFSLKV